MNCQRCLDEGWVCEVHPQLPALHGSCRWPGTPCPLCNTPLLPRQPKRRVPIATKKGPELPFKSAAHMIADPFLTLAEIENRLHDAGFDRDTIDAYLELVSGAREALRKKGEWPLPGLSKPS